MKNIFEIGLNDKSLTSLNKSIIRFIDTDPFSILDLSIDELASQCYTTKSSIVQTLKKIGISGYKELKNVIINSMKAKKDLSIEYSASKETINNIKATEIHLKGSKVKQAAELLMNSKKVAVIGGGSISYIGAIFSDQLNKMGIRSTWYEVQDSRINSEDADLFIFLSNSGVNKFIWNKARLLKEEKNKTIISITASNSTNILSYCDYHLPGSRLFTISKKEYHLPTTSISIIWFIVQNTIKQVYEIEKEKNPKLVDNI